TTISHDCRAAESRGRSRVPTAVTTTHHPTFATLGIVSKRTVPHGGFRAHRWDTHGDDRYVPHRPRCRSAPATRPLAPARRGVEPAVHRRGGRGDHRGGHPGVEGRAHHLVSALPRFRGPDHGRVPEPAAAATAAGREGPAARTADRTARPH